jgi:hypothetical protein
MSDEYDCFSGLHPDFKQFILHTLTRHFIERAKWFIHEKQWRVDCKGTGDGNALLHTSRKFPGSVVGKFGKLNHVKKFGGSFLALGLLPPGKFKWELNVPGNRAPIEKGGLLECDSVQTLFAGVLRGLTRNLNTARVEPGEVANDAQ